MTVRIGERAREWQLVRRPLAHASIEDLELVETAIPQLEAGQVLVRNTHLSVDPYMRGRMEDRPSYIAPFQLHAPLDGAAIGVVVESRAEDVKAGQVVEHFAGLREFSVIDAGSASPIDPDGLPAEVYLGPLGATGLTAWLGITQVAPVRPGDTVFVTGAAGAVGSIAGQIAKLRGARQVIGSAGSAAKVRHLRDTLHFDTAFDHHDGNVGEHLSQAAPDGIDVVFDNVGGVQLDAAIGHLRVGSRLALCGMVSQYDSQEPYGIRNLYELVTKRATVRGFLVSDHYDQMPAFRAEVGPLIRTGKIAHRQSVLEGIERVPEALLNLLHGGTSTIGKAVVRLPEQP